MPEYLNLNLQINLYDKCYHFQSIATTRDLEIIEVDSSFVFVAGLWA